MINSLFVLDYSFHLLLSISSKMVNIGQNWGMPNGIDASNDCGSIAWDGMDLSTSLQWLFKASCSLHVSGYNLCSTAVSILWNSKALACNCFTYSNLIHNAVWGRGTYITLFLPSSDLKGFPVTSLCLTECSYRISAFTDVGRALRPLFIFYVLDERVD